jgi:hypothetical protein
MSREEPKLVSISELTKRYRIGMDEVWKHERPEVRNPDRRWYEQIPCRGGGLISLKAEDPTPTLQLYTTMVKSARTVFNKIKHIPGVTADFHYDGEAVIYFPPEILNQVAKMAGARIKRQGRKLTPTEKSNLLEAGKAHRFKNKTTGHQEENLTHI